MWGTPLPDRISNMRSSIEVEWLPNICPNGHRLLRGDALVGWEPCSCYPDRKGHRTVTCRHCGATWYRPPHTDDTKSAMWWQ